MAENIWTNGATNGLWNDGANWSLGTSPADGEDIVLNGTATASITGGFETDALAKIVRSFHRHPNYTGSVGTSGDPLVLATQARDDNQSPFSSKGKVIVQGPGGFYYVNGGSGTGEITADLYIDTDTQDTAIEVNGAIDRLYLLKGRVTALSSYVPQIIDVGWRTNPATDVHLTLQHSQVTSLFQSGGTVLNTGSASMTAVFISGGTFDHGVNTSGITQIVQTGGLVIHRSATTTGNVIVLGGVCDYSQDARAKTVTLLRVHPGAEFKQNANITITGGGTILPITDIVPRSF